MPTPLAETEYSPVNHQHVSLRLRGLAAHGLVAELATSVSVIIDRGELYLAGDLDAGEDADRWRTLSAGQAPS